MPEILHITPRADWEQAGAEGEYRGDAPATEGYSGRTTYFARPSGRRDRSCRVAVGQACTTDLASNSGFARLPSPTGELAMSPFRPAMSPFRPTTWMRNGSRSKS